jgi:Methyltransferase FkbM domain
MSSLLPASEFGAGYSSALATPTAEQVTVRRLDGLLDEVTAGIDRPRLYLKLDTQGFDLPAFRGAGDRIREIRAMQSEVACIPLYDGMARLPEQLAAYESAGFEMAGMFPVTRHKRTRRVIEFDMTLVRSEAKQDDQ